MHINKIGIFRKIAHNLTRILPSLFSMLIIFSFDEPYVAILTLISAAVHEGGHIFAAWLLSGGSRLRGRFFGFALYAKNTVSYKKDILITLAGPLSNIILFLLFINAPRGGYFSAFALLNLFTALSNLMPIHGYDGYRIAECLLLRYGMDIEGAVYLRRISFALLSVLAFLALYLMAKLNSGFWIFFIFIALLIKEIKNG